MKAGDLIKFVEHIDNHTMLVTKHHLVGKTGVLIKKVTESIADDWGAAWSVLVEDKVEPLCYERWMEVINESR